MSKVAEVAIIDAVLAELRTGAKAVTNPALTVHNSEWQPDGKPPPNSPDLYVSVDEDGMMSGGDAAQGELKEVAKINVWISIRAGSIAPDRRAEIMRRNSQPLSAMERKIIDAIHGNQTIRAAANASLAAGDAIFHNPLYYAGRVKTEIKDSSWASEGDNTEVSGWVVRRLPFIGMRRVYYIGSVL